MKFPSFKLRMAHNSLFAILLRSPWWISFAIAAVLTLIALAVLPPTIAPYAISVGLPFVIIGSIALYRQARLPSAARVTRTLDAVRSMSWPQFSNVVEQAFRRRGYEVRRLRESAADFEISLGSQRALVSCKRWKAATHGIEGLRELQASSDARETQERIYIALNPLSDNAKRFARDHQIEVIQDTALVQLVSPELPEL